MRILSIVLLASSLFLSCTEPDCVNSSAILNSKSDQSLEYQSELANRLQSIPKENLRYTYESYQKEGGKETITVNVYGDSLCVDMKLVVNDWTKLAGVRREPSGYRGAEIKGLTYDVTEINADANNAGATGKNIVFVYRDLDKLID